MNEQLLNTIIHGDCLEEMTKIASHSVDAIISDPPYGTTACKWDSVIPLAPMWTEFNRIIKPNGAIVLTASQPFTSALVMSNIKDFRYCWIWDKMVGRGHLVAKKRPMCRHEDICVFYKSPPHYNPIMTKRDKLVSGKECARTSIMGGTSKGFSATYTHKYPQTIISIASDGNSIKKHPTQKPVALMSYLVRTYTNPGDVILDPCCGSGTTCVAAMQEGRKFIGIEKDAGYAENSTKRILQYLV